MKQALVVIDAQQELIEGNEDEQAVYRKDELLETINAVISKAIEAKVHIIFVRDKDVAGGEGEGFQVHKTIHVPTSAVYFDKLATNAFYQTGLLDYLQANEVQHLVMMGCKTEHCVDTAVRTATVNGFDVTLVADGHSTNGSRSLSPEDIVTHHNDILHGHYNVDHFSLVRNADEALFEPSHNRYR
ncbi:isochorismatase family protein [Lysinibacillus cavernae]|uniref:isochorismatase family protein n=1 Tax=Lysinibacillus cavernae TaxID=2666135 RepID=UPI0012D9C055|nr:isochorismatase family protein [Lysinibacillus cavernae]